MYGDEHPEEFLHIEGDAIGGKDTTPDLNNFGGFEQTETLPTKEDYEDEASEEVSANLLLRDRAMQFSLGLGIRYDNVESWLDDVDKIEAKLTTGKRMSND